MNNICKYKYSKILQLKWMNNKWAKMNENCVFDGYFSVYCDNFDQNDNK